MRKPPNRSRSAQHGRLFAVLGPSLGTMLEWYDFFVYGTLASTIALHFFPSSTPTMAFIYALVTFAIGFAVRPVGAALFGSMGDRWGRKRTFLTTMTMMGVATVAIGAIPVQAQIGVLAPALLILARVVQGLAIGGEYGGAVVYVAEQVRPDCRGLHTSFIQVTATAGLVIALGVVAGARAIFGETAFQAWAWRVPFLFSAILLAVSIWIRQGLAESKEYRSLAAAGNLSRAPLREALGDHRSLLAMSIALFGMLAGMTSVWYTAQFYSLFFLERVAGLPGSMTNLLGAAALIAAAPGFVLFGWLSDRVGRKPVILTGCLLAALTLQPLFGRLTTAAHPALVQAAAASPARVIAHRDACTSRFDPLNRGAAITSCDVARALLARRGVHYALELRDEPARDVVMVGGTPVDGFAAPSDAAERKAFEAQLGMALDKAGYAASADPARVDHIQVVLILFVLMIYATMCYGPAAAALCEMFPARLRYTSVSLPYNIATGVIGGFLPASAFAIVAETGNPLSGLWYPIGFCVLTVVVGGLFWTEKRLGEREIRA